MAVGMVHSLSCPGGTANIAITSSLFEKFGFLQICATSIGFKKSLRRCGVPDFGKGEQSFGVQKRFRSKGSSCNSVLTLSSAVFSMAAGTNQKQVLLPIANDSEEMEVVIVADVLRRAGADVTIASVENELEILASRKVKLVADTPISSCEGQKYDLIVIPGGMPGAARLRDTPSLKKLVQTQAEQKRLYAAICAAPAVALQTWDLLTGLKATCHPSFTEQLTNTEAAESIVVQDGLATTSRGPGTCFEFALSLVDQLYGKDKMNEIAKPLVMTVIKVGLGTLSCYLSTTMGRVQILRPFNETPCAEEYNPVEWKGKDASKPFRVLVPVANGSEEMEAVIIIDVFRRAGFDVCVASVEKHLDILASRKVKIVADTLIEDVVASEFDAIVLPGGMPGAEHLRDCDVLVKILRKQVDSRKIIAAICASPAVVFESKGFLKGKKATSFPSFSKVLPDQSAVNARVVIDGLLVTSRGPGTAMEFALAIVEKVLGFEKASSMAGAMVLPYSRVSIKQAVH